MNADGTYQRWLYAICRKPEDVLGAITAAVGKEWSALYAKRRVGRHASTCSPATAF